MDVSFKTSPKKLLDKCWAFYFKFKTPKGTPLVRELHFDSKTTTGQRYFEHSLRCPATRFCHDTHVAFLGRRKRAFRLAFKKYFGVFLEGGMVPRKVN